MFADIVAAYYRRVISLYLNEDGGCCDSCGSGEGYASCGSGADEYLFNSQTITCDTASAASGDKEMPRPLAPPLFSYC